MAAKENFEASLQKLEDIVEKLESPDLSLDQSLKFFEEGIKQAGTCEKKLREAEGKLEKLIEQNGLLKKEIFSGDTGREND